MKRLVVLGAVLSLALWTAVQSSAQAAQQNPPASGQNAPAQGAAQPQGKRPPQAKTQPEFDAYKAATAIADPAALEKAADDFAVKFPDSELRSLLYKQSMRVYQNSNNGDKTEAMGRKVLGLDEDDPEALVTVSEIIAERTRESDLDKDQRYDEAMKMSEKATRTVDTDVNVPAGTPQDKLDAYKALLRSNAYSVMGTIEYNKNNFAAAEGDFQKSIDTYPSQPDSVVMLRLALALDKQNKYPDALKAANRAVELTQENTQVGILARRERDRLQQLTRTTTPAPAPAPAPAPSEPPKN